MTIPIKQNTAQIITVGPFLDKGDGVTPELSLTVTGCHITMTADTADGSAPTLVIDADATASGGDNDLVHITNDNAGYYSLELTAAQTNRVGGGRLCINDDDVHCPVFHELEFLPANVFDARFGTDKLQVDAVEVSGDSTAADNLESACDGNTYNVGGGAIVAASVTTKTGYELAADQAVNATKIGGTTQTGGDLAARLTSARAGYLDVLADLLDAGRLDLLIDAIKAKTDNLPADPADESSIEAAITAAHATTNSKIDAVDDYVDTEITAIKNAVESATYGLSALKTLIDAIKAKSDLIPADIATALAHLNADIDSRMATFSYTAPANADIAAVKVVTDYLTAMLETDGAVKRYTANALEQAPSGSLTAPTVEEIRAEMDSNSTKLANLDSKVSDVPTVAEIDAQLSGAHGAGAWGAATVGATEKTYTVTVGGVALEACEVWATSDLAGATEIANRGLTNDLGQHIFYFDVPEGTTVYIWRRKSGYTFTNPDTEVV